MRIRSKLSVTLAGAVGFVVLAAVIAAWSQRSSETQFAWISDTGVPAVTAASLLKTDAAAILTAAPDLVNAATAQDLAQQRHALLEKLSRLEEGLGRLRQLQAQDAAEADTIAASVSALADAVTAVVDRRQQELTLRFTLSSRQAGLQNETGVLVQDAGDLADMLRFDIATGFENFRMTAKGGDTSFMLTLTDTTFPKFEDANSLRGELQQLKLVADQLPSFGADRLEAGLRESIGLIRIAQTRLLTLQDVIGAKEIGEGLLRLLEAIEGEEGMAKLLRNSVAAQKELAESLAALNASAAALAQGVDGLANAVAAEAAQRAQSSRATARETLILLGIVCAVAVLIAGLVGWAVVHRSIGRRLNRLVHQADRLRRGELTHSLHMTGGDEIGDLAGALETLRMAALEAEQARQQVEEERKRASAARREAFAETANSLEAGVAGIVGELTKIAHDVNAATDSLGRYSEAGTRESHAALGEAQVASENVASVASGALELSSSISEIGRQLDHSAMLAMTALDRTEDAAGAASELARAAEEIDQVVQLIAAIAGQTNLLALNATIEAARAGEHGKGFAVVAGEVKSLANQSAQASNEIGDKLQSIRTRVDRIVDVTKGVRSAIDDVNATMEAISDSVQKQDAATAEIARSAEAASEATRHVHRSAEQVATAASGTEGAVQHLSTQSTTLTAISGRLRSQLETFLNTVRAG